MLAEIIYLTQKILLMKKGIKMIALLVSIAFVLSSCAVNSTLTIQPNEEFVLGEYQNTRFSAKVSNLSKEEVKVSIIDTESKKQTQGFGLPGKNNARINVSRSETVVFKNFSDKTVKVKARISRNVKGMRFQSASE
jgi:hypothetical protein